ncbi:hypothetical protein ACFW04_007426 [Cataglyphis niger]
MSETWIEEKEWGKLKEKLPKKFTWKVQRGREMLIGVKEDIKKETRGEEEEEGRIICNIRIENESWRIISIYVNGDIDKKLEDLKGRMEKEEEEVKTLIGGNFKERTGEKAGWTREEELEEKRKGRRSKDKKINGEGRMLIDCIESKGWSILNKSVKEYEEEEFTYIGEKRETVIDYIIEWKVRERIERLEIGGKVASDHYPVIAWLKGKVREEARRKEKGKTIRG